MSAVTVDEYIAAAPDAVRPLLSQLREIIREAAPEADEVISYQMPAYKHYGMLVSFAAWKNHIGLYPMGSSIREKYAEELEGYETSKGTVRFPISRPLPAALIRKIIRERVIENEARKRAKGSTKSR